jgi:hypothetical protein
MRYDAGGGRIASARDNGAVMIDATRWWKGSDRIRMVFWSGADSISVNRSLNLYHAVVPTAGGVICYALRLPGVNTGFRLNDNYCRINSFIYNDITTW